MPALDAVCFDLDRTLCVSDQDDDAIHDAIFARVDPDPFFSPEDVFSVTPDELPEWDTETEHFRLLYREICERKGIDPTSKPLDALAEATVEVLDHGAVSFREGAREAFEYAREHCQVAVVTNGPEKRQAPKLEGLGIRDALDAEVYCHHLEPVPPKPDPDALGTALSELGVDAERAINVGDALELDVAGAAAVGMASAWVPLKESKVPEGDIDVEPTYRLDSMADLPDVIEGA